MPQESKTASIIVKISDVETQLYIGNANELMSFHAKEVEAWAWTAQTQLHAGAKNFISTSLSELNQAIQNFLQGAYNEDNLKNQIEHIFSRTGRGLPFSKGRDYRIIESILGQFGGNAAIAATSFAIVPNDNLTLKTNFQSKTDVIGVITYLLRSNDIDSSSVEVARKMLNDMIAMQHGFIEQNKAENNDLAVSMRELVASTRSRLSKGKRIFAVYHRRHKEELSQLLDSSKAEIQVITRQFNEHMKLKAPVQYWSMKAYKHEQKAKTLSLAAIGLASLILALGSIWMWWLLNTGVHLIASISNQMPVLFALGASTVAIFSIVFWVARVVVRLYLSEHHLSIDARERETMAQTYIALLGENASTDQDRAIVLAALFRPTADGIVKDDAAPDFSIPALASKLADRR